MTAETTLILAVAILVLPLLSFVVNVFWGKRLGKTSSYIGTTIIGISLLLSLVIMFTKLTGHVDDVVRNYPEGKAEPTLSVIVHTDPISDIQIIEAKFKWIKLGDNPAGGAPKYVEVGIGIDNLAALMLIVVTLISFLVHLFSMDYMAGDKRFARYYSYLGIFSFSMLGIVIANNFLFMYVFWELVGLSSYLLIGFWYEKDSAANAGKKAFLTNRIGDLGFLIGILIMYFTFNTFMFDEIFGGLADKIPFGSEAWMTAAGILVFCGAIGKSAQFPLHVWLPDAMEGPTPVSALIHAATMVAAGVYMVARVFPMFTADALMFIAYVGAITAFIAATIAITQRDFKKVLAYSTVSQLGYMVMSLGVGAYATAFFHLMTHAWFKAGLFLGSGSVIHAMHHADHKHKYYQDFYQDINNMGGLRKRMPWTYYTFLMFTIAISGVPLTSGFLSKDGILAGTFAFAQETGHWLIPIAGFGAAGITAFYMFRLLIVSFHGKPKSELAEHAHENKFPITFPLVLLAILTFSFVYTANPFDAHKGWYFKAIKQPVTAVPPETQRESLIHYAALKEIGSEGHIEHEIAARGEHGTVDAGHAEQTAHGEDAHHGGHGISHYANEFEEAMHHAHIPAMVMSVLIASIGIFLAFMIYQFKIFSADNLERQLKPLHTFSFNKWYFDELYAATAIGGTVGLGRVLAWFDLKIIDGFVNLVAAVTRWIGKFIGHFDLGIIDGIVNLTANVTGFFGAVVRKVQTGRIQTYVALAVLGIIVLILIFK